MKILMIGDIVAKPGIEALEEKLENIKEAYNIDFTVANIENASGTGITKADFLKIEKMNIDAYTLGNHTWGKLDGFEIVKSEKVVRPANFSKGVPGSGIRIFEKNINGKKEKIAVINLIGRVSMNILSDNPFVKIQEILKQIDEDIKHILVDFHTETTAEIKTMGYLLDGKVTAVVGTHTHVQTADEKVLEGKTAYISDLGMTGIENSVLGMKKDIAIKRFVKCLPERYKPEMKGKKRVCGVVIETDDEGKAKIIERINF